MGEAGPEAIMPLKRGRDGKLGVALNGSGASGSTVINISVTTTGETNQQSGPNANVGQALAAQLKAAVMDVLITEKRPGGILYQ